MSHEQRGLPEPTDDWAECSFEIQVDAWGDRDSARSPSRVVVSPPLPPPRRLARGSGRLPPVAGDEGPGVHYAATMIRPPTATGRRTLRLPLRPPSELDFDVFDDTGVAVEEEPTSKQELSALCESFVELEPLPRIESTVEAFVPTLAPAPRRYLDLCLAFAAGAATASVILALLA